MTEAPVGFRCPECAQSPQVRQPVTVAGATHIDRPVVTYTLIGVTVAVFLVQLLQGIDAMAEQWGMWPIGVALGGEWWRLITSAFLHGSFLHIAFNMYVLFALGPTLERILGHGRYIVLYITAAFGGSVASYVFSDANVVSVGASGAIFGLMGALVVAGKRLRYDITQVLILIGINIAIGFIAPGVDWRAHLGGLVAGAAVAGLLVYAPRRHRTSVQVLGLAGVWAVLIGVALWRTAQVQEFYAPVSGMFT
jgi:membrane associated rhomboid family serine protease